MWGDPVVLTNYDIPLTAFTNGLYPLPSDWTISDTDPNTYYYQWWVQAETDSTNVSAATPVGYQNGNLYHESLNNFGSIWLEPPYFDGRAQLKQNLIFQLRAATTDSPFQFTEQSYLYDAWYDDITFSTNYVYSGFYQMDDLGGYVEGSYGNFDVCLPFFNNCRFQNFVFDPAALDTTGYLTNGVYGGGDESVDHGLYLEYPAHYEFQAPTNLSTTLTPALATNQTHWLNTYPFYMDRYDLNSMSQVGFSVTGSSPPTWTLGSSARNYWGLPYVSAELAYNNTTTTTVYAGGSYSPPSGVTDTSVYSETAQPQFSTAEYDFWNYSPVPGATNFLSSQSSDLLIAPVGGFVSINGYAKLAVSNGYSGVYGYLAQYFDKAYQIDTNGIVTTNTTGVLSPYGQFFATQHGSAALVTMPDLDTGARGTCAVYCVSMNVDANHDGTMDTSFNGADATSQASPMVCWINNGYTQPGSGGGLDKDLPLPLNNLNNANCFAGKVTCPRDLENFFRLWICGVPSLPVAQNYTYTLSMSPVVGNPAVNVYWSCETNGGIGYLTDTNIAAQQANTNAPYNFGTSIGMVSGSKYCTLNNIAFAFGGTQHLLFEGTAGGEGQLTFTITDSNSNLVVQTSVWLELHDVKDFFEQDVIQDSVSGAKSNWTSYVETVQPAVASGLGNDTNMIVLVHGINVRAWDCIDDAGTVCKRLYWAGFQGKFAEVHWPCNLITPFPSPFSPALFNDSELQGYKASTALTTCLNGLKTRFPNYRLNILAHSQGNAVVSEAIKNGAPFDTYILTQGAMPDSAYDVNATNDPDLLGSIPSPESQPMGYLGIYTNLTGNIVNFYNPNDPVLDWWVTDQKNLKPSIYLDTSYYFYDGTNSYYDPFIGFNYLVTDPEESRAEVSRSRTLPIGQSGPASAHGVIQSAVDLHASFGFDKAFPDDHSAQWTWPIQTSYLYYKQILLQIQPTP